MYSQASIPAEGPNLQSSIFYNGWLINPAHLWLEWSKLLSWTNRFFSFLRKEAVSIFSKTVQYTNQVRCIEIGHTQIELSPYNDMSIIMYMWYAWVYINSYIYSYFCGNTYVCGYTWHLCMWRPEVNIGYLLPQLLFTLYTEERYLSWSQRPLIWLAFLASLPQGSHVFHLSSGSWLYMGAEVLNSNSHVCVADILSTEQSCLPKPLSRNYLKANYLTFKQLKLIVFL